MKSEENLVFRENTLQIFAQNLVENVAADAMQHALVQQVQHQQKILQMLRKSLLR